MTEIFSTIRLLAMIGGGLLFALLVLLSMPQSRLRELVLPFVGWAVTALSAAYVLSPIDAVPEIFFGPFGLVDDAAALAVGIASALMAMNSGKRQLH